MWISSIDFGESDFIDKDNIRTFPMKCSSIFDIASDQIFAFPVCLFNESQNGRVDSSDFHFDSLKKRPQTGLTISLRSAAQTKHSAAVTDETRSPLTRYERGRRPARAVAAEEE
jgi:hypothetical protein